MNASKVFCLTALIALGSFTSAFAGWTAISLQPEGSTFHSSASGISGGQQVGSMDNRPTLWTGTAGSAVDLTPAGYSYSSLSDISGGHQVGSAYPSSGIHAGLWNGTAGSFVDLHPGGDLPTMAYGCSNTQQVGVYDYQWYTSEGIEAQYHACMWSGTAASYVNLHPIGAVMSEAYDCYGDQQVGVTDFDSDTMTPHATLWTGTAASFIDLNPAGSMSSSANDVYAGQQVGYAIIGDSQHAGTWTGTAASFVDLHPASGYYVSRATGVFAGRQVGVAVLEGFPYGSHACIWNGTAASFVDLHSLVGPTFTESYANAVEVVGDEVWVAGQATNSTTKRYEAFIWHYTPDVVPEPSSLLAMGSGVLALAGMIRRRK